MTVMLLDWMREYTSLCPIGSPGYAAANAVFGTMGLFCTAAKTDGSMSRTG